MGSAVGLSVGVGEGFLVGNAESEGMLVRVYEGLLEIEGGLIGCLLGKDDF